MENRHRARHGRSRARGQLRRPLGARGGPNGGPRAAASGHGAHVSSYRTHAGSGGVQPDRQGVVQGKRARAGGLRAFHVTGLQTWALPIAERSQTSDGTRKIATEQGTVEAEHVVNCGGLWAREVRRMAGLELPLLAMEHMYLLTEPMPEVEAFN